MMSANVKKAVPFFGVTNMEASLRFYVDGGPHMTLMPARVQNEALVDSDQADHQDDYVPDGRIRWCWLELGEAENMLKEHLAR
jgi:lactoylglutathione lyase